jgi:hypothetical protein
MHTQVEMPDAQELFEDLQLSSAHHSEYESTSAPTTSDSFLLNKLESASHRRRNDASVPIDVDAEIAKLISLFAIQGRQYAFSQVMVEDVSVKGTAGALPPPVRYSRASRRAVAKSTVSTSE